MATVKDVVKETLVGGGRASLDDADSPQLSVQSRARFISNAVKDPETGELYLGTDEFINAITPQDEDFHKIKREQYSILFRVADRKNNGRVTMSDWGVFENLLTKPDSEYEVAFRLFDVDRTGNVRYDDFRQLYELNKGADSIPFDWDGEWAKLYIGSRQNRHNLDYPQFAQMLRGLQGERIRQAFHSFDRDGSGYIEPEDFGRIIVQTARHKLSDHLLDNLHTLCNISQGSRVSYANVRAFQNVIRDMDLLELIVRRAVARSPDSRITRTDFLNEAVKITRSSLFTPMEADILFHFAGLDKPSGRLGLADFAKVLDPMWRNPTYSAGAGDVAPTGDVPPLARKATGTLLHGVLESVYNFGLGSVAGAFGAFMVYPIDLVKTRMQNQRGAQPGQRLYKNSIDCFQKVVRNEGFRGLYSGVLPQLVGVAPEKAIKLTVNDLVRGATKDKDGNISLAAEILAGASAGTCQVVFTNPLEIVKIRLQVQGEIAKSGGGAPKRSAMWIVRNLGLVGLYKGATACLLRDMPFSAIYFPAYFHLKKDFFGESPTQKLSVLQLLTAGAIAGMPAAYLTTPCDVIKTRLQVEARKGEAQYTGLRHAARTIWREEGFRAFFKGGPARIFRSSPQFGFTLAAYEVLQTLLPMPGGKKATEASASAGVGAGVSATATSVVDTTPLGRSRNALKVILDLDEDFGRAKLPDALGWKSLPRSMGGGGGSA
ncbi:solute carrier family 25 (mitochondrial aspartate/glutamate transporter), member 12/13 [Geosmithia morbida]|uniref:Mitochondrial aspartate-glutamate transporter AGC1 n=1 Tax=Geosmithia morbida TaxID=1094350 RepID=A0A9P4YNA0_9HYPO|nr:solute carrier family 25 (mitochondrial aspartate/glutamate transporter), member 12/13 [Geosmithia morbida]KAF4119592.1 solute carrier family 25 (mitochondrial aspartate/glutamate transporter), member 12/13 [Geosmithia morbida]